MIIIFQQTTTHIGLGFYQAMQVRSSHRAVLRSDHKKREAAAQKWPVQSLHRNNRNIGCANLSIMSQKHVPKSNPDIHMINIQPRDQKIMKSWVEDLESMFCSSILYGFALHEKMTLSQFGITLTVRLIYILEVQKAWLLPEHLNNRWNN